MSDYNDQNESNNTNQNDGQQPEVVGYQQSTSNQDQYQQPVQYQYQNTQVPQEPKKNSGMAVASMVLGIVSIIISCFYYLALPAAIVGLVLGIISIKGGKGGKGMAIAGIIMCSISILIGILLIVSCAAVVNNFGDFESLFESIYDGSYNY